jgi:hypothetical protein
MRVTDQKSGLFAGFVSFVAAFGRGAEFTCGDCDRWARCGMAPSEDCIYRAAQMSDGGWVARKRARTLAHIVRPM